MKRYCYLCNAEIFECMGSVHAASFLNAMINKTNEVYELCPKCVSKYANLDSPVYPQPSNYKEIKNEII